MPDFIVTARTAVTVRNGDRVIPAAPGEVLRGIRSSEQVDALVASGALRELAAKRASKPAAAPEAEGDDSDTTTTTTRRRRTTTTTEDN